MTETLTQVGSQIIAGGSFTSVAPAGSTSGITRDHVMAFDSSTGQINPNFDPDIDGTVYSVEPGPSANTVYVGGNFRTVDGVKVRAVALLDTTDGHLISSFNPAAIANGYVKSVRLSGGHLFIAGSFSKVGGKDHAGLATLDPNTGALDPYMDLQMAGHHNYQGQSGVADAPVGAVAMDVNADSSHLIVIGNFTSISGQSRDQIAMVDLGTSSASVDQGWATEAYTARCFDWAFDTYMRAVNFSPNGNYFVVTATGGSGTNDDGTNSSCDTAARYETTATGTDLRPTWIDYTGQDTLTSVAVTGSAAYVGGHERWMNNSKGHDQASQGAVPRPGLAALNVKTGMPYSWNPGRQPRGVGTHALLATADSLYAGYDTDFIGNRKYRRERLAKFPLAGGETVTPPAAKSLPADVYLAEPIGSGTTAATNGAAAQAKPDSASESSLALKSSSESKSGTAAKSPKSRALFRIDSGGPAIRATDGGPNWMADRTSADPGSRYCGKDDQATRTGAHIARSPDVSASVPTSVFETRQEATRGKSAKLTCKFPVASGTPVQVRVFLAGKGKKASKPGDTVINLAVDGKQVLEKYDVASDVGGDTGTMKSFNVTSDGEVNLAVTGDTGTPFVNAVEVIAQPKAADASDSSILERSFDGTTVGTTDTLQTPGMDWSSVHGAFIVNDHLFYGSTDGYLHERTFDGKTFGDDTQIDPYDDPAWSNIQTGSGQTYRGAKPDLYSQFSSVTGMFFLDGRLYYTKQGNNNLYSRWFEPESGIIGSDTFTTTGGNFSNAAGMFYADGHIYYADRSSGNLIRVDFDGTTLDGSSATVVSGPGADGNSWGAGALFLGGAAQEPNKPPTAAFEDSCHDNVCDFDASGSSDPDGTITSYDWDFGDDSSGAGKTQSHAYTTAGTYNVTLTVTDNDGATSQVTHQVSPSSAPASAISFVGASHSGDGASKSKSVVIPTDTQAGDAEVLFLTQHAGDDWSGIGSSWRQVGTTTNGSISSTVWVKEASSSDAGSAVTIDSDTYTKSDLSLSVYSGADVSQITAAHAGDSNTATHVTPELDMSSGDLAVSYWADKSSSTTEWTAPASVTSRDTDIGTGAGRFSHLTADSDTAVAGGDYGGLKATTDAPSGKAIMWTVDLPAGSTPPNQAPIADFTSSCEQNVCTFDGSASSDPDGSVASYQWDFGDGSVGVGKSPTHAYADGGNYTVKLVVSDNHGANGTVSHQVSPAASGNDEIQRIGGDHSGTGAAKSKHVDIPASVKSGDTMVLFFTRASDTTWTTPGSGWTQTSTVTNGSIESSVWVKKATSDDPGSTVKLTTDKYTKGVLVLGVYSNVDTDAITAAHSVDSRSSSHTTPSADVAAGDVVVSFWSDKSSGTTDWTSPKDVPVWASAAGTGAGRYSFLLADSGARVTEAGTYGDLTATTDARSGKAAMWTVVLPAADE